MSRQLCLGGVLTLLVALPAFAQYSQLATSDDGKQVYFISSQVLQGKDRDSREPRLYRAAPDSVTLFVERGDLAAEGSLGTGEGVASPSVSGDGTGPAFLWVAATGATIPIPLRSGELANGGTISGNGEIAFVATTSGRIVKFVVATGNASSLFPEPPHCDDPGPLAYGSLARLRNCTFRGTVAELQHHIFYNELDAPVLYVKADEIGVYLPVYKDFFGNDTLSNDLPNPSPFQAEQPLHIADAAPAILPAEPSTGSLFGIQIIKGDFSGYVTRTPLPGDIIHMYMIGLGPVDAQNANRMQWKLACRFQPNGLTVEPLFAGLAPGFPGVYQTTFAVPAGSGPVTTTALSCDVTAPNGLTVTIGPGTPVYGMCSRCIVSVVP
jgi:uncharacterized protein (TIGR03437 family)